MFRNVIFFTQVLEQEYLRNIKNSLHLYEQNELNIGFNIPKSFFLNLNHYLILLYDAVKLGAFDEDLFHWA